jgi:ribonuclease HII
MGKAAKLRGDGSTLITGIDEAGRGALIGPMVICGITAEKSIVGKLKRIGVRDSKELTPAKREELYHKIKEIVQTESRVSSIMPISIPPCRIDAQKSENSNLNLLEARTMAEIIGMIGGEEVYLDALTSRPERFKRVVLGFLNDGKSGKELKLEGKKFRIIAENDADKRYPIVSAASIIAKVERDRAIELIKQEAGVDFGVGYPHDQRTVDFVDMLIKTRRRLPAYVRKSWITTRQLQEKNWQRRIKDFILGKEKKM